MGSEEFWIVTRVVLTSAALIVSLAWSTVGLVIEDDRTNWISVDIDTGTDHVVNKSESATLIRNSNIKLKLDCSGSRPTEWVFNYDNTGLTGPNIAESYRESNLWLSFQGKRIHTTMQYLSYKNLSVEEYLICRSLSNHSENILIKLDPNASSSENSEFVRITKHPNRAGVSAPDDGQDQDSSSLPCKVKFFVTELEHVYYWHCRAESNGLSGTVSIQDCYDTNCANVYRKLQIDSSCATLLHNLTSNDILHNKEWNRLEMEHLPGVALCRVSDRHDSGAVEYFFTRNLTLPTIRELHFVRPNTILETNWIVNPPATSNENKTMQNSHSVTLSAGLLIWIFRVVHLLPWNELPFA